MTKKNILNYWICLIFIILLLFISVKLNHIDKSTQYVKDYLYRWWTMYENQVILIDKIDDIQSNLEDVYNTVENIYYNM
jgi:hypothetical protein